VTRRFEIVLPAQPRSKVSGPNEFAPVQAQFQAFNERANDEIARFMPYAIDATGGSSVA
jgi:hypothetical protein